MDVASTSKSSTTSSSSSSVSTSKSAVSLGVSSVVPGTATATTIVQLPISSYFPNGSDSAGNISAMQFYTQTAAIAHNSSNSGTDGASNVSNAPTVQLQQQQAYLNPALAYQQWFSLQVQQQQQQQQQDGQVTFATIPSTGGDGGGGGALTFASSYLDPQNHQNLEFHNGQVQVAADGALSLSTLQSFANSLQQHGQGQAFMIQATPVSTNGNGLTTLAYASNPAHDQHHAQHHGHQNQQHVTTSGAKGKASKKAKSQPVQLQHQTSHSDSKASKPPKPKGSPNAYALFYKDTYAKLRAENPEWKASQIMAEAGKIWKEMNGSNQDSYRSRAESLNQQHQLANANSKSAHKKQKNQQKRPMTAYQLFIREHFGRRPPEVAQMHAKDFLLQLSVQWKNLEPSEKLMYQDKAKAEKTRRENEAELANGALSAASQVLAPVKIESSVPTGFASASS